MSKMSSSAEDDQPTEDAHPVKIMKIIVVGDSFVGKTCLTYRFCKRKFLENTEATIGVDFYEKTIKIGDQRIKLQLWDTAGQERYRESMIQHYYRNVHAVVIVYDITKLSSFKSVNYWVDECEQQGLCSNIPKVLVGMKCDKEDNRIVSYSNAQRLADSHGMPLFETSAFMDSETSTVDAIFTTLAYKFHNERPFRVASITSTSNSNRFFIKRRGKQRKISDRRNCC